MSISLSAGIGRIASCGIAALLPLLLLIGCGSGDDAITINDSRKRFDEAMQALENEDFEEARQLFTAIVIQDPAGDVADDAQFYLAETEFRDEKYRLAAFNYNRLRSSFPNSPYYKMALFRASECYYYSSPPFDRDQRDTRTAIEQYRLFIDFYPNDSLVGTARKRIVELRTKLAHRDFSTAELYFQMEDYASAEIYYDKVAKEYPDTEYFGQAILGKVNAQLALGKATEAKETASRYLEQYPDGVAANRIRSLTEDLPR